MDKLDYSTTKLIACATVIEEMVPLMPPGLDYQIMEFGLHTEPDKLRSALQKAIDGANAKVTTVLLGYGLCSRAMSGLKSDKRKIVVPKVDDCIAIFLGSDSEYQAQHHNEPGTLYQTKGWIEADKSLNGLPELIKKYGESKARLIQKQMLKNYTRLAFINTGNYEIEHYRGASRQTALDLGLDYVEISGSNRLIRKLIYGPWDGEFVIAHPGQTIKFMDFRS
jgi:hypothetical protein